MYHFINSRLWVELLIMSAIGGLRDSVTTAENTICLSTICPAPTFILDWTTSRVRLLLLTAVEFNDRSVID